MRGQYRIISEIILFSVGILITGYVIVNFNNLENAAKQLTLDDQANSVADLVATAIIKAASEDNATIRLTIPERISGSPYMIALRDAGGGKLIISKLNGTVLVERQLFNMRHDNTIGTDNIVIENSEVFSSAQYIEIVKTQDISIRRR